MTKYFYAHDANYGINTTFNGQRLYGTILRFPTRAARDAWVEADRFEGFYRREAVSAADVRAKTRRMYDHHWDNYDHETGNELPYERLVGC